MPEECKPAERELSNMEKTLLNNYSRLFFAVLNNVPEELKNKYCKRVNAKVDANKGKYGVAGFSPIEFLEMLLLLGNRRNNLHLPQELRERIIHLPFDDQQSVVGYLPAWFDESVLGSKMYQEQLEGCIRYALIMVGLQTELAKEQEGRRTILPRLVLEDVCRDAEKSLYPQKDIILQDAEDKAIGIFAARTWELLGNLPETAREDCISCLNEKLHGEISGQAGGELADRIMDYLTSAKEE